MLLTGVPPPLCTPSDPHPSVSHCPCRSSSTTARPLVGLRSSITRLPFSRCSVLLFCWPLPSCSAPATAARCRDAASPLRVPPERCRPPPPAPAAVAMAGKECVAIASDLRFGVQLATLATDYKKIYKIHDQLFIGLAGLGSDAETL